MTAIEIIQDVLNKNDYPEGKIFQVLAKELASPTSENLFRRQIAKWKMSCWTAQELANQGANEELLWRMLKRHLNELVGWNAGSELGREAGSTGYDLCVMFWIQL